MPRFEDERGMNSDRNRGFNQGRGRNLDRGRITMDRSYEDDDQYMDRDLNLGGSYGSSMNSRGYGEDMGFNRSGRRDDGNGMGYGQDYSGNYRSSRNDYGNDRLYNSADTYGENIGQQGLSNSNRPSDLDRRYTQAKARGGFFGKGPKGWKRSDDRIKEEVSEALYRDSRVDASDIEVTVKDACVSLSGTVDSRDTKRAAEICAENISGVDDVQNNLKVNKMGSGLIDAAKKALS